MSTGTRRRQAVNASDRNKFASLSDEANGNVNVNGGDVENPIVEKVLQLVPHRKDDKSFIDTVMAVTLVMQVLGLDNKPSINVAKLNAELDMLHWEVDEQKQHSMNENVMVHNVKELDGEVAVQIVTQLVNESGVECAKEDLSTAHRVGKRSADRVRPLVAKFVRKDMRTNLLRKGRREHERSELQWVKEARV